VIVDALGLRERRYVHLIGGGGKTTLLFAAAGELAAAGRTVLTTTTTRILFPRSGESPCLVVGPDLASLLEPARVGLAAHRHVTVLAADPANGAKAVGLPVALLDALVDARLAGYVLVEADGASGRPLKAHADHEPVVSSRADLVVAVVGVDCLGAPVDDAFVHRAALLRERLALPAGTRVTPEVVAGIVLHRDGWLARVPAGCEVAVVVNKVASPEALEGARRIAATLRAADAGRRIARIVAGEARTGKLQPV
jgi:probable selenium-dependent hydroxylase accessory protein YqeC